MLICCSPQITFVEQICAGFVVFEDHGALPVACSVFDIDIVEDSVKVDQVVHAHIEHDSKVAHVAVDDDTGVVAIGLESESGVAKIEVLLKGRLLHDCCYQKMN